MLELVSSGLVSVWLKLAGLPDPTVALTPVQLVAWQDAPITVLPGTQDPTAIAAMQRYLKALEKQGLTANLQGLWFQSGPLLLTSNQGSTPLPAASLTKIATTLVSLDAWGPDYQFETLVSATGPIRNGVLQGDLVVRGGGDPLFVWEEAIALANSLSQVGLQRVTGKLIITGNFLMNYEPEPPKAGELLKQAFNSKTWSYEVEGQYDTLPRGTPRPQIVIQGPVVYEPNRPLEMAGLPLLRRRSLPLSHILRLMNIYSNNFISEVLAETLGGGPIVAQRAAALAGVNGQEIRLANGSGLGMANRISPHAACAMLAALQRYAQVRNLSLADLFPVAGLDGGTIEDRQIPVASVVKTGTLNEVSALAGVLPTQNRGLVWFAIINRGTDLDRLRSQQDVLLQTLQRQWGGAASAPPATVTPTNFWFKESPNGLGAAARSEILFRG